MMGIPRPCGIPLQIRPFEPNDWPGVWRLLEPVFRAGETFPMTR